MANKLRHAPAAPNSAQLTQSEYESEAAHTLDNGVAEDLLYFDGTEIARFPKGADGTFVGYAGGVLVAGAPGAAAPVITKTAIDYAVLVTDDYVLVDTSAGNRIITMPAVSVATKPVTIKKVTSDANTMTITPAGTDTIDGAANMVTLGVSRTSLTLVPNTLPAPDDWAVT